MQREQQLLDEVSSLKNKHQLLAKKLMQVSLKIPLYHKAAAASQNAPTGTVCLVFTDVQGSTRQWEAHPTVMARSLKLHNDLMRKKILELDGYEVKTEGDSFM